jgi:hypothetical protein
MNENTHTCFICIYVFSRRCHSLYPKKLYLTSRGQSMSRFMAFLMPVSLALRKIDGFEELWRTTHDHRVLPMIVADEICEPLFMGELYRKKGGWHGPILRNYWDETQMEHDIRYLPLGPRYEYPIIDDNTNNGIKTSVNRRYLFNMMVSLDTDPQRQVLETSLLEASALSSEKHKAFERSEGGSSRTREGGMLLPRLHECYIHNSKEWQSTIPEVIEKDQLVPTSSYQEVLLDSVFTLCPSGHNPETFRLYEASEAGSIPIVDFTETTGACLNPWKPFLESGAPFVWVRDWSDIVNLLTVLRNDPKKIIEMQQAVQKWYHTFMKRSIQETVEGSMREHLAGWLVSHQETMEATHISLMLMKDNNNNNNNNNVKKKKGGPSSSDAVSHEYSSVKNVMEVQQEVEEIPQNIKALFSAYKRAEKNKKSVVDPKDVSLLNEYSKQQDSLKEMFSGKYELMKLEKLSMRSRKYNHVNC